MVDDAEFLRQFAEARSEAAFAEFVNRHLNLVYFTALRCTGGNCTIADDATQAVFSLAARRVRTLLTHPTSTGWLHTTTRYIALRLAKKERTRERYERKAAMADMISGNAELDWTHLRPVIDEVLAELPVRDREAILLRFFENRAFSEIGTVLGMSPDAARMRVERGLRKLGNALERRGIESVSAALAAALTVPGGLAAPVGLAGNVTGAALAAASAASGFGTFLGFMSGTKIIAGAAALLVAVATGTAVLKYDEVKRLEVRLDSANRELAVMHARLVLADEARSAAEAKAVDADKDNATLLAAVDAARRKTPASVGNGALRANRTWSPEDPLTQTLHSLFPNGIVATIGDRVVTVEDVRRQIAPRVANVQQTATSPEELRQRLYALQNGAIADLVTRQLDIKEFNNPTEDSPPKHIASEAIDAALANRVKEQFNNDQARFLAYLAAQGVTLAEYRQTVEEDIQYSYMRARQKNFTSPK